MTDEKKFRTMLELVYEKGGSPQYVNIAGLGEMFWPALSEVERAFALGYRQGWIERWRHETEKEAK